jgi:uncharacterized protein (TIGR02996 family)
MNNVKRLLEALADNPGDDAGWLALADALEEQGDVRAEVTRLSLWLRRRLDDPEHATWERQLREWLRRDVRVPLPQKVVMLPDDVKLKLVLVPPGSNWMGSPEDEEGRSDNEFRHRVTLRAFWIGMYPVTQRQFRAVMGYNSSHFNRWPDNWKEGVEYRDFSLPRRGRDWVSRTDDTNDYPVENVSWEEAKEFCHKLTEREQENGEQWEYRLPTEAEWEYACRAGTTTKYHNGDSEEDLKEAGWYDGNSDRRMHSVGQKEKNAIGLHDMHGLVWEWCEDWYSADYYRQSPANDPPGPGAGSERVFRGGGWGDPAEHCRVAYRPWADPEYRAHYIGFRLVAVPLTGRPAETRA